MPSLFVVLTRGKLVVFGMMFSVCIATRTMQDLLDSVLKDGKKSLAKATANRVVNNDPYFTQVREHRASSAMLHPFCPGVL